MDLFEVSLKHSAEHDLRKLDRQRLGEVLAAITALAEEPFPSGVAKLTGTDTLYRLRVGSYRVIPRKSRSPLFRYEVDAMARLVVVHYIRHRRDAYRRLAHGV
jgi:mRNA interferase RelE/StbE